VAKFYYLVGMELDLKGSHAQHAYSVLTSLVTPRPIAWVSSLNENGSVNVAPFSYFNVFGSKPPILAFSPGNRPDGRLKDTAANIKRTQEFVVHMVEQKNGRAMVNSAVPHEVGISEASLLNLDTQPSKIVSVPRLVDVAVSFECRLHQTIEIGQNRMMIGEVEWTHVRDGILDPETLKLNAEEYEVIGRMASPNQYCETVAQFAIDPDANRAS